MNAYDLINKRLSAPKNFKVTTTYSDGAERVHLAETAGQAETYASVARGKIGRDLISHGDELGHAAGEIVRVVSVEIDRI